jgi:NIPSNAP
MKHKTIIQTLVALAIFGGGYWSGMSQTKSRVFELRTYTANPGKLGDLNKRFREHTLEIFKRHGMTNVAYFTPQDAPLSENTLVYLLAHESRDAAKKSWDEFRNDPEWKKVAAESEANGKIVDHVVSQFLVPTDYSPMK